MLSGSDTRTCTDDLESEKTAVAEQQTNLLQDMLPIELQIAIFLYLVQDEDCFKHLHAFMRTSKRSHTLINDLQLLQAVAKHWAAPENISKLSDMQLAGIFALFAMTNSVDLLDMLAAEINDDCYLPYSLALNMAASHGHLASTKIFLERLAKFPGPHYVGEALKTVAGKGYLDLAQILTQAILTKGEHSRDWQLQSACRLALEHQHWDIVSLLMELDACRKHSELSKEVVQAASQADQPDLVNKLIGSSTKHLGLLDKLSVLTQPGYQHSGVGLDVLFGNHSWLVRAPLCFALGKLGYQPQPSDDVDVDVLNELLAELSIEQANESAEETNDAIPAPNPHKH